MLRFFTPSPHSPYYSRPRYISTRISSTQKKTVESSSLVSPEKLRQKLSFTLSPTTEMSTPSLPTLKTQLETPTRPSTTSPSALTHHQTPDPSSSSSSLPSSSVSTNPAQVARPSAFSIRPDFGPVQTRIRARSINSGKGVASQSSSPN